MASCLRTHGPTQRFPLRTLLLVVAVLVAIALIMAVAMVLVMVSQQHQAGVEQKRLQHLLQQRHGPHRKEQAKWNTARLGLLLGR